jgi:hypothetical protein
MALRRTPSWRARAVLIVWGLLSHILLEPSMSVNKKVTVPLGGATICYVSSFSVRGTIAPAQLLQKWKASRTCSISASRLFQATCQHTPDRALVSTSAFLLLTG